MSGTSAFLRRCFWAKFDSKIPFSTASKTKVRYIESLIRGHDKTLFTEMSILAQKLFFIYLLSGPIWYVWSSVAWFFGSSSFATDWVIKVLLYTAAVQTQNAPSQDKWLVAVGVITFMRLNFFSDATSVSFLPNCFFRSKQSNFGSNFSYAMSSSMLCSIHLSRFNLHSQRKPRSSCRQNWWERFLNLRKNDWNTWGLERVCVSVI